MRRGERVNECKGDNIPSSPGHPLCLPSEGFFTSFRNVELV